MDDVKLADFDVGETYEVEAGGEAVPLRLEQAEALPRSMRESGDAFRLHFRGPDAPIFPQGVYRMSRGEQAWELFIVPLGPEKDGRGGAGYEVIFN